MANPEPVDELVRWFLQTLHSNPHGEVGIHAVMQDGKLVQTRRLLNATQRPSSGVVPKVKWTSVDKSHQRGIDSDLVDRMR